VRALYLIIPLAPLAGAIIAGLLGGVIWIPVVAGLYAIGALLVPGEKGLDIQLAEAKSAADVKAGLDHLLTSLQGRVADDLIVKVMSIRDSILSTIDTTDSTDDDVDPSVYLIRQTALSYLPDAFATYLKLPRYFAEHRAVADGRTPHDVLLSQLELMDTRLQDVADNIAKHDTDKLLANGRFLAEKFAVSSLDLDGANALGQTAQRANGSGPAVQQQLAEPVAEAIPAQVSVPEPTPVTEQVAERESVH